MCIQACLLAVRLHIEAIVHYRVCCYKDIEYSESQLSTTSHTSILPFNSNREPQTRGFTCITAERLTIKYETGFYSLSINEYSSIKDR